MTSASGEIGPDQETDSALRFSASRDFDGGLVRRWSYVLTEKDALAYLRLRKPWTNRQKAAFGLSSFIGGALAALFPVQFVSLGAFLLAEAIVIAGFFAGRGALRKRAAHALIPKPRPALFEEWIDCIAVTDIASDDDAYLSPELIGPVALTRDHIVIRGPSDVLLIPIRAFASQAEAREIARFIADLSKGPYYFQPQD